MSDFTNKVNNIFSDTGLLADTENFEYRSQQQEMAEAIAESLEGNYHEIRMARKEFGRN